ncbi:unnamed protein product [Ambrosiozyma monospora]|uniref:Unnamed protein product n=1 Tax=Ambrosiozyma monospora TaxID=43982 RepID=A0A9W6WGR0_AMBMO|nr:unnamed protein product [Ambrosiozyma monospora]
MDKYSAHKPRKQRQSHRHHSASGPSTINSMNQQKSDNNTSNYKLVRPPMAKRTSSSSSATKRAKSIRHELKRRSSSNNGVPVITSSNANPKTSQLQSQTHQQNQNQEVVNDFTDLKHSDYMQSLERDFKPSHVMLNHLITCNSKMEGVITGSCIHRYSGKFITQIMYFPIELGDLPANEGGQSGGSGGGAEQVPGGKT